MGIKIGDVSPAAALMGEKGAIRDAASTGALGLIPKMMTKGKKGDATGGQATDTTAAVAPTNQRAADAIAMKKGGKVKKSSKPRGSGCCKRTKKCKMY